MAELRWGSTTHEGQVRDANEDHAYAGPSLFVVADGMGGHLAGEVASEIAVNTLRDRLADEPSSTIDDLVSAISDANRSIFDDATSHPDHLGMGTTVTAIAVVDDPYDGEALAVANVGDSRIYLMRNDRFRQVTIDHSFVQELVAEGAISRDEARVHPRRNIVTRGLGIEPVVQVDSWTLPIVRGDRFVLCSDGLSDYVHDDDITDILRRNADDPQAATEELTAAANAAGGPDNITVVIVDVLEGDDPPDPTEEFDTIPAWDDNALGDTGETPTVAAALSPPEGDDASDKGDADTDEDDGGDNDTEADSGDDTDDSAAGESSAATSSASEPSTDDNTVGGEATPAGPARKRKNRLGRLVGFVLTIGVIAVIVGSFTLLAAWARSGYFVDFDEDGVVYIYQGRPEPVLWFQPTAEAPGAYTRDELTPESVAAVEERPEFSTFDSASRWVSDRLVPLPAEPTVATDEPVTGTSTESDTDTDTNDTNDTEPASTTTEG